ncbi:hypothetical protein PVAP13_1KG262200 [Panicum virgatum]|uniref:Uncharacterized protein n=1 Tax=Panicum virgatum TaxID=38727 RepID=A0A8T0XLN3_PANVG|nr:hypothetical protein PVAP13_1KG262200 [Panicum virgatum]
MAPCCLAAFVVAVAHPCEPPPHRRARYCSLRRQRQGWWRVAAAGAEGRGGGHPGHKAMIGATAAALLLPLSTPSSSCTVSWMESNMS